MPAPTVRAPVRALRDDRHLCANSGPSNVDSLCSYVAVSAASRVLGTLELTQTAQPLLGALNVDGSDYWLAWNSGTLYGLRSSTPPPGESADGRCLEASPGQSGHSGALLLCVWSVRMTDQINANDVRIHGVSLGDVPTPLPTRTLTTPAGEEGVDDGAIVDASSKLVNVWLRGGTLLSLALESGERVGNLWVPVKPPIDADGSSSAAADWAAAPHAVVDTNSNDGSTATVLGSALVLLGAVRCTCTRCQRQDDDPLLAPADICLLRPALVFCI